MKKYKRCSSEKYRYVINYMQNNVEREHACFFNTIFNLRTLNPQGKVAMDLVKWGDIAQCFHESVDHYMRYGAYFRASQALGFKGADGLGRFVRTGEIRPYDMKQSWKLSDWKLE